MKSDFDELGMLNDFEYLITFSSKYLFWFNRVLDRSPEQRESKLTVLCPLIIIILINYITIYYIIIKLLIMENHPSRNQKRNSKYFVDKSALGSIPCVSLAS